MPELPEVHTITNQLKHELIGAKLSLLSIDRGSRYGELRYGSPLFNELVVNSVENIAKLIVIGFENSDNYLIIHLGMTGQLLVNNPDKYVKVHFRFIKKGSPSSHPDTRGTQLYFSDIRKFGFIKLWNNEQLNEYKNKIGPTPLDPKLTENKFAEIYQHRKTDIKSALLNQKIVRGIGNIYATDALFLSGIHPQTPANKIPTAKLHKLFKSVKDIINEGIEHKGSSMNRYVDLYGVPGIHQNFFRVYGKRNSNCPNCKTPITYFKIKGRGSFHCSSCQPIHNWQSDTR